MSWIIFLAVIIEYTIYLLNWIIILINNHSLFNKIKKKKEKKRYKVS